MTRSVRVKSKPGAKSCLSPLGLSLSSDTLSIARLIPILSHPIGVLGFPIESREPELILFDLLGSSPTAH